MTNNIIQHKLNRNYRKLADLNFIYTEVSKRMLERLEYMLLKPKNILDIGSGLAVDSLALAQKYPSSRVIELDLVINLLRSRLIPSNLFAKLIKPKAKNILLCANALNLPLSNSCIDLVWSNLTLPYIDDIPSFFKEIRRVLTIGGAFLVSGFGVDTFKELRQLGLSTYNFPDMHLVGDILVQLGFNDPVTDVEVITLQYTNLHQLLEDIRSCGCGALAYKTQPFFGKKAYAKLQQRFDELVVNGIFNLTLEVYYAHSWKDKLPLGTNEHIIKFV